ncbi:uncharacterized protein AMSG_03857 [Thecamonas trahens ATCC 50062]|uniref:vesicle-fusing ATPase n=1 Tax=Thecamonas trahens ATCC 50062 TaxID=461836 RepID=A0A0L0D515_THETB|nr:hypothetical protein AMSG_03857 [Thecamonas trahens ATCC 50062]KNC47424.1 hypothetical protein AMSG_03857 [Thecamonas trahens ATCC 50062]|eukprot:XP_013759760.1 hypothetical protein AMSG_03857 [Thecamonas trahens ATCC 50062]
MPSFGLCPSQCRRAAFAAARANSTATSLCAVLDAMSANFREQGIAIVKRAVEMDHAERYAEAYSLYTRALEYFTTYLKYEKSPSMRDAVRGKVIEYLERAEQLKTHLDDEGRAGVAVAGGGESSGDAGGSGATGASSSAGPAACSGVSRRRSRDELLEYLGGETLANVLHRRVVGQDTAVDGVARGIMRYYEGWRMGESPMVFLFVGPSGVGKTELAKAIAEACLGDASAVLRVDMGEYQERHSVAKLLGAPSGYVGSSEGTYFAEELRANPATVVLLDEVEKAHPDVLTVMLSVFDEGRFTPSKGGTVYASDAIFIMTSNLGADVITGMADGSPSLATYNRALEPILKAHFKRDEFLGRIDDILPFEPFTPQDLASVINLFLAKWVHLAASRHGLDLTFDAAVVDAVMAQYNPKYGVRSVKHIIEREVGNTLADASSAGLLTRGVAAQVTVGDAGNLVVELIDTPRRESGSEPVSQSAAAILAV